MDDGIDEKTKRSIGYVFTNAEELRERFTNFALNMNMTVGQCDELLNIIEDYGLHRYDNGYENGEWGRY